MNTVRKSIIKLEMPDGREFSVDGPFGAGYDSKMSKDEWTALLAGGAGFADEESMSAEDVTAVNAAINSMLGEGQTISEVILERSTIRVKVAESA